MLRFPISLAVALAATLSACGTDPGTGDDQPVNCAAETDADDFVVGLTKPGLGGVLQFELISATPAPPARGDNEWMILVSSLIGSSVGAPVDSATIAVTPFMPKHGHGTPISAVSEPQATAGQYKLSPINLWMPGLWETTVEVTSATGNDMVVFKVCIPG